MEEVTEEISDLDLNDFTYGDKTLAEWQDDFTVSLPRMPAQAQEVSSAIQVLNDKYQLAYNCYAEFKVLCSSKNNQLYATKNAVIARKLAEYKTSGAKPPGKDVLESLALASVECKALLEDVQMYELIMEFFECHKVKLEKAMQLFTAVSYSTRSADKMHDTGAR